MNQNIYFIHLIQILNFKFPYFIINFNFMYLNFIFLYMDLLINIIIKKRPFLILLVFQIYIIIYNNFYDHILLILHFHINHFFI